MVADQILSGGAFSDMQLTGMMGSLKSIILVAFLVYLVIGIGKKAVKFLGFLAGFLLLFQVCFLLGQTSFDSVINLSAVFSFDVFSEIAGFFSPSPVAELFFWFDDMLRMGMSAFGEWLAQFAAVL